MAREEMIGWFSELSLQDRPTVGGKGGSLGELTRAGIPVPDGFVVRTAAFERFLDSTDMKRDLRARVEALDADKLDDIMVVASECQTLLQRQALPSALLQPLTNAYSRLCANESGLPVAIRSSATAEDAEDASFAGLQDTLLWVRGADAMQQALRQCWASLYSTPSLTYRRKHGLPEAGIAMAVVVQKMVDARTAGVMFTRSPTTGDKSVIVIEAAWGLGSAVVSGEVTPDRFVVAKITSEITVREIRDKHIMHVPVESGGTTEIGTPDSIRNTPCLNDDELQRLREMGRRIERHYGRPQDIEWAFDKQGQLQILQSRPETVWSQREVTPVTQAKADALEHVMSVFGGRQ